MAPKYDPGPSSGSSTGSTPVQSRRRTKSVPISPSGGQDGGEAGSQIEQLQIAESPAHEAAGGHPQRRDMRNHEDPIVRCCFVWFCATTFRQIFWSCGCLIFIFGFIIVSAIFSGSGEVGYHYNPGIGQVLNDQEWNSLYVDIVFPGDPDYINGTGYNPDGNEYIQELVAQFGWQSRACGMSFRNLKNEKPPPSQAPPKAPTQKPEEPTEGPEEPTEAPEEPTEPPQEPPPDQPGGNGTGRLHFVGSRALKPGEFPWNLAMFVAPKETGVLNVLPFCGATLIASTYAVTAAHCLPNLGKYEMSPYYYWVSGGAVRLDQLRDAANREHQLRLVRNVLMHQQYPYKIDEDTGRPSLVIRGYDIGILSWEEPFRRLHTRDGLVVLSPICLPSSALIAKNKLSYEGVHFYAGMGETGDPRTRGLTDRVRVGEFRFNASCGANYPPSPDYYINSCRDPPPASQETGHCRGDSGGQVSTQVLDPKKQRYFLSGIISFGVPVGCTEGQILGNVRVEPHLGHIDGYITNVTYLVKDIY